MSEMGLLRGPGLAGMEERQLLLFMCRVEVQC